MNLSQPPILVMSGISKSFPGVKALQDVSLSLHRGEVLALMGENGAGKSTLMKIVGGVYTPDAGSVEVSGVVSQIRHVKDSKSLGIALIHQELLLSPNLSIAANLFLGNERLVGGHLLKQDEMNRKAKELLHRLGLNLSPKTLVSNLSTGQMQMVEIAKALLADAKIIVMDEPTASLTAGESERLFGLIDELRKEGRSMIYISHRIPEVVRLSDRIVVLRDGKNAGELTKSEVSPERIVTMMVGRSLSAQFPPKRATTSKEIVLNVANLVVPGTKHAITFSARRGEILGFAGLVGAGRTELMQTLFGVTPAMSGEVAIDELKYLPKKPSDAIRLGVFLAPEDRKHHGLVLPMSIANNVSLPDITNYSSTGFLRRDREREVATTMVKSLRVRTPGIKQLVVNLSGGNQQKVVLGKWLAMKPKILILDEPTRGVDVGAKAEIYQQMLDLAKTGITILMVSSDMEEVLGMSDRVAVMHERKLIGVIDKSQATPEKIGSMMTGTAGSNASENSGSVK